MTAPIPLAADFPAPDRERWRALAKKALGKASWESLTAHTADGIAIAPLYTAEDAPAGAVIGRAGPWDIRQIVETADPRAANGEVLAELNGGASSIELRIAQGAGRGVHMRTAADLAYALDGMMLDLAPVALDFGADASAARLLGAYAARSGVKDAPLAFNLDPFANLLDRKPLTLGEAIAFAKEMRGAFTNATALRVDARPVHEAGGGEAQELAFLLAAGVALLRAGEDDGLAPSEAAEATLFTMAVGPDVIVETAKLRTARLLWARALQACGAAAPMRLHAATGRRMMTKTDVWTNMLRVTAAAFAAGIGGADCITTLPLTDALGQPNAFARRIARNTQILLQEEAHAAKVADPGAGSYAIEKLTDDLARAAWALFQEIEQRGGIARGMDWFAGEVAKTAAARLAAVRDKSAPIVGVTVYPPKDEKAFVTEPWPTALSPQVLAPMRLSEPFEPAP
ncbi:MAG: methylmalonyl-CoA mutase family protein [Pseudomonadota bacterium]